jgi:hypothetical protein
VAEKASSAEKSGDTIVSAYKIATPVMSKLNCACVVILEPDVANRRLSGCGARLDEDTQGAAFIGKADNWEAGRNPALPPQRWWSETRQKATGEIREGAVTVRKDSS